MKNLRKSLIAALMLLMAQVAMAQMMMPLPVDKDVRAFNEREKTGD